MARFIYKGQDAEGHGISGTLEAADRESALQSLAQLYPLITSLEEQRLRRSWKTWFSARIPKEAILVLFQQLSVATAAGVQLKGCLDIMAQDAEHGRLQQVLFGISSGLTQGLSMSQALAQYPDVFDALQVKLVKAGETSGRLPETLRRLADDLETRETLTHQVRSAFIYPGFILTVALVLAAAMLAFGVPQVQEVYSSMGGILPVPTRVLVFFGDSLSRYWELWLVVLLALLYSTSLLLRAPNARRRLEDRIAQLPLIRPIYHLLHVAFFARTLGLLYRSGVPLSQSLEIVSETLEGTRFRATVKDILGRVTHGAALSRAMRASGFFPALACEMVHTGENSGSLEKMLDEIDRFYSRRCEVAVKTLVAMIEPALTVVVGILLGGIILGLGLPFLNMPSLMM